MSEPTGKLAYENLRNAYADLQMQNAVLNNLLGAVLLNTTPGGRAILGEGYYTRSYNVQTLTTYDNKSQPMLEIIATLKKDQ